jgi:hypothetical protein
MKIRKFAQGVAAALAFLPLTACENKFFESPDVDVVVPTEAQAQAEAEQSITADNASAELDALEKEIEADAAEN